MGHLCEVFLCNVFVHVFFFVLFLDDHCFREEYVEYELVRVTISLGLYINTVDCWFGKSNKMLMCSKSDGSGRS